MEATETLSDEENGSGFAKNRTTRVNQMRWGLKDSTRGELRWIHKSALRVDRSYQRDAVSNQRVVSICRLWSWVACGCLIVVQRPDGTYWIVDGQHRKLAADKRADIQELPCIVFCSDAVAEEAEGYVNVNTVRGAMRKSDKFKAELIAGRASAIAVNNMIAAGGYRVSKGGEGHCSEFFVGCIGALQLAFEQDEDTCRGVWQLCVELHQGAFIRERLFNALFFLERKLRMLKSEQSLLDTNNVSVLASTGVHELCEAINKAHGYFGKGGAKVSAQGVVDVLNRRRRTRRLPNTHRDEE